MLKSVVGRKVEIRELNYLTATRDKQPEEVCYQGRVKEVDGHLLFVEQCVITQQHLSRRNPGNMIFNTMASSFVSFTVL